MSALPGSPARAAPLAFDEEGDPSDYPYRLSVRNTFIEADMLCSPDGALDPRRACSAPPDSPSSKVGQAARPSVGLEQPAWSATPRAPAWVGPAASSSSGASLAARPAASSSSGASAPAGHAGARPSVSGTPPSGSSEEPGGSEWPGLDLGVATDSEGDPGPAPPWAAAATSLLNAAAPPWEPQARDAPGEELRPRSRRDRRSWVVPPPGKWAPAASPTARQGGGVQAPWAGGAPAGPQGAANGRAALGALPSQGSAGHHRGFCKPCAFFANKGCGNGFECPFCHLCDPGEKKKRRKEKMELRRSHKADRGRGQT